MVCGGKCGNGEWKSWVGNVGNCCVVWSCRVNFNNGNWVCLVY